MTDKFTEPDHSLKVVAGIFLIIFAFIGIVRFCAPRPTAEPDVKMEILIKKGCKVMPLIDLSHGGRSTTGEMFLCQGKYLTPQIARAYAHEQLEREKPGITEELFGPMLEQGEGK